MVVNVRKNWEVDYVNCSSSSVAQLIAILRGGESITIKSHENSEDHHHIGTSKDMVVGHAFQLDSGESMTLTLPISFGKNNYIEIYALPTNANKKVSYFKLIDLFPQTAASD